MSKTVGVLIVLLIAGLFLMSACNKNQDTTLSDGGSVVHDATIDENPQEIDDAETDIPTTDSIDDPEFEDADVDMGAVF